MAQIIQKIQNQLNEKGLLPRTEDSRKWLMEKVRRLRVTPFDLFQDRQRLKERAMIGRMYFYYYDPKTKEKLPYYDIFPLVIPIELYKDGFLGLNLHYLPPKHRLILLNKLSEFTTNKKYDEKTRLRLSYGLLSRVSKLKEIEPCLKRYLFSHIQSRFLEVESNEWEIAIMLPVEKFQKKSNNKVWTDSRKKI